MEKAGEMSVPEIEVLVQGIHLVTLDHLTEVVSLLNQRRWWLLRPLSASGSSGSPGKDLIQLVPYLCKQENVK